MKNWQNEAHLRPVRPVLVVLAGSAPWRIKDSVHQQSCNSGQEILCLFHLMERLLLRQPVVNSKKTLSQQAR